MNEGGNRDFKQLQRCTRGWQNTSQLATKKFKSDSKEIEIQQKSSLHFYDQWV